MKLFNNPWRHLQFATAMFILIAVSKSSFALPITVPTGLNPGDQYRLVFVTSTTTNATSTNIATYNSFVDAIGDNVISSDWRAIVSTSAADNARDNTNTDPINDISTPIYLLNDTLLTPNTSLANGLWSGTLANQLSINENGIAGSFFVWTGSTVTGLNAVGAELGTGAPIFGATNTLASTWITVSPRDPSQLLRLYAISGILTVPAAVPEPGSFILMTIGGAVIVGRRLRSRFRGDKAS